MSRIVLSTMGSLGDLHPMMALGLELRRRGHSVVVNTWQGYSEKIVENGLEFAALRPDLDPTDAELIRKTMDARTGPEMVIREIILPSIRDMYDDMLAAVDRADVFLNGEIVYTAASIAEKTGVKWITTTLSPLCMFSSHDPNVYPQATWLEYLRPLPAVFHRELFRVMRWTVSGWYEPYKTLRRELSLDPNHDPIFTDKFSPLRHLAMFSEAIGKPQPDWPSQTIQTGFCFYDESETLEVQPELSAFLDSGEPPIVFTLGSAAVMDARDFFDESAKAAKLLGRRAVLLYGRDNAPPKGLDENIVGFEFAPYSLIFPRAACVVHQAGVGTTAQVLRAGVPHLIVPFSHDQPDNAARCRRAGVAEIIGRDRYNAESAAKALSAILANEKYRANALPLKRIIDSENGTKTACDAIEDILR
ncbi:MAG: glycosyltransferase family 1 protein [Pyrinomonadaceae bacterium]|nr:glycosyltransferase family 1 protein [Pyrinomonadaceae bacterium]